MGNPVVSCFRTLSNFISDICKAIVNCVDGTCRALTEEEYIKKEHIYIYLDTNVLCKLAILIFFLNILKP
ncbi:hypothetical protein PFAG_01797 [Plasmodium falciparum Santa Lucia]|uniref:Uncharacterized protein n=1 Tax=Plasmodium falciparum Santa Lucia TaxID=478859 RepID=W7FLS3_PLAFA|nr:hypothetical protein PFAG_01797 [Plasmodium falciparum Santa Lucia]